MDRNWQDFKELKGGIEGARAAFETACETLFRKIHSDQDVSQIEVKQGDGGIDIFIGSLGVEPITVIQCKFFLYDFGDSQKDQIRKSFKTAIESEKYELERWILCIPSVMDIDSTSWWFKWRKKTTDNLGKNENFISLKNGNELIDLMKEYGLYNQVFQTVEPNNLSKQLLLEIGEKSLSNLNFDAELFIERNFKPIHQNTLIVGVSGSGKTTYCINVLKRHLALQKPVLVLDDNTVNQALSIEEAIDIELRRYANELVSQSGHQALEFCSIDEPLIILVEDINRSSDSARLLRKLIDWSKNGANFILLCPVWHRLIAGLSYEEKKSLEACFKLEYLESYNENEAKRAIIARVTKEKIRIDELSAANIAQQLGYDPLLISLANLAEFHENSNVIEEYVHNTVQSIATRDNLLVYEIEDAIDEYGLYLFQNKKVQGESRDLRGLSQESQKVLKQVLNDGRLFRQAFESPNYTILSRHDRLNYYIIAKSIISYLEDDNFDLTDPYFSEIIGISCALASLDKNKLYQISIQNSLVAFHCYAFSTKTNSSYLNTAVNNVKTWLETPEHQFDVYDSQQYQSLIILNDVFHTSVPEILNLYSDRYHNPFFYQISFKQGNLSNGLQWISTHHFDTNVTGEKQIIDHVFNKYGEGLVKQICENLIDESINYEAKHQLLRLIGYTENTSFANAVRTAWHLIPNDEKDYRMFFWAAARVCDDDPHSLLEPIFDYWESLSDEENEYHSTDRAGFAAHGLKWKFSEYVPHKSIAFILQEAEKRDSLNFYILYMLSDVDNADVLEAQATRLANSRRQGNSMPSAVLDNLRRNSEGGKILSIESKERLLSISESLENDEFLRKSAFNLWEMSPYHDDLVVLQKITNSDIRFETALMGRAKRKDMTAIDELVEKINDDSSYWWQATRYIWHEKFEQIFEEKIANVSESSDSYSNELWMVAELYEKLEIQKAEEILIKYWNNLSYHYRFIQIALMIATPKLQELVASTLENEKNIKEVFKLSKFTLGIRTEGRKGVYRYEQMKALQPYFKYHDERYLSGYSEICLKQGWEDISQVLEPLLIDKGLRRFVEVDTSRLNDSLENNSNFVHWWISDRKKEGWAHQRVVEALFNWFNQHQSEYALDVIFKPLSESGKRTDYLRLENIIRNIDNLSNKEEVLSKLFFNIYSRSLE
ncbi:ATP-binding protein [Psychrobacter frigidicola]|uniref:ATP-binding protein n=1 Tax=Psychrobacter frigidicola TaxID=45611 RepID=A0A5C7A2L4_9GAMM|nr:ATP-binding protein [Psychrobacter frigidicola]TXD96787.1 ATP-binding protein [Psychrobacter frigidicola]